MSEAYDAELKALEASLGALKPAAGRIDRDRILFQAGQASVKYLHWTWPELSLVWLALFLGTAALAGLGVSLTARPQAGNGGIVLYQIAPKPANPQQGAPLPAPEEAPSVVEGRQLADLPPGYLRTRDQVIRLGPDALPQTGGQTVVEPPLKLENLLTID